MAIVEDEKSEVFLLQLYHQVEMTEDILVPGGILIIKDPYLKLTADGRHGLRVDHVSDAVFLLAHDRRVPSCWHSELTNPQLKSADFWKTKGKEFLVNQDIRPQLNIFDVGSLLIRQSGSRGRGLFTTKAVKTGDLMFCEKAFAYAFHEGEGTSGDSSRLTMNLLIDINANSFTSGAQPELITMLVRKLYRNPSQTSAVKGLHCGSYSPVQGTFDIIDGMPVIDSFLLTRILLLNSFGCKFPEKAGALKRPVGIDRLGNVFPSLGLWTFASHMHHSCLSNAFCSFIGDMTIVRAIADIPVDAEITIQYLNPFNPQRQQKYIINWAFACDCAMCEDDDHTSDIVIAKRKRLGESLQQLLRLLSRRGGSSGTAGIASLIRKSSDLLAEMEETYIKPTEEVPRLTLWVGYRDFACALTLTGAGLSSNAQKAIEIGLKALRCLRFVIESGSLGSNQGLVVKKWGYMAPGELDCWICLKTAYDCTGSHELALAAEGCAKVCCRIQLGEAETFQ
ncbi:hypothetical protein QC763_610930 [Podospora pseudopauciseta]|uniref:SET domain-containing protein n=1 Tax=Podospora pseudopauciseta TaxID=2093780 RepID=A0ABR0H6V9_9PEZI|nr:hypothetical protein QC763_610930 [Podospora pseudopauciseta]